MTVKGIIDEDFVNYKKCSMFIAFPTCTWKCGKVECQNSDLALSCNFEITANDLIVRYLNNPLTSTIVCGGLEPMDSFDDLMLFIQILRYQDKESFVVIFTGYDYEEVKEHVSLLTQYNNIIVKFGRYIPNQKSHYDDVLGIYLSSDNQYAEVIS